MTEENSNDKTPGSGRSPARKEKPNRSPNRQLSPHNWDFESYFPSDPPIAHAGRVRASSWDDSDDNLPPLPDFSGSKTCRIYTSDDKYPRPSVSSEINELKKQFFKNREKLEETEVNSKLESMDSELEAMLNNDRRQTLARIRRRTRSSGSSSPAPEIETQVSSKKGSKDSGSESDFQDISPKSLQYDPGFYLNNFFTELRSKRISQVDPLSVVIENIGKDIKNSNNEFYDLNALDEKDPDPYFCKTSRKLSQILEVEENRKDLEKSSEENITRDFFENNVEKLEDNSSPLQTDRSKKSLEKDKKDEKYKSLSLECFVIDSKSQKPSQGSLSERSAKFFDRPLDNDFIQLSAKTGKTHLASPKKVDVSTPIQVFSPVPGEGIDKDLLERLEAEKRALESLKLDFSRSSETSTPRKSTARSGQSHRNRSGKSRRSYNADSPKFMINIGDDSARSLKLEDMGDFQEKDNAEECSCRKSENERKTERIPPLMLESPSCLRSAASTERSLKDRVRTNRSKSQTSQNSQNSQRSYNKNRKESTSPESKDGYPTEPISPVGGKTRRSSRRSSAKSINNETEQTSPNSRSSITSSTKTPKTIEKRLPETPGSNKSSELNIRIDLYERPESEKVSNRSQKKTHTPRKDSDGSETKPRSNRQFERSSSSRSKHSPQGVKMTPKSNSGSSRRSKDSLEVRDEESTRLPSWKEYEKASGAVSDRSSVTSMISSWREAENQQHSYRGEAFNPEMDKLRIQPENNNEKLSRSRNSSRTSEDSNNSSPARSGIKSKPNSCTPRECPVGSPHDGNEKTHISFFPEEEEDIEDEDIEENLPTHRSRTGDESERFSNHRLSVINEVSVEDFEMNNTENKEKEINNGTTENKEKDTAAWQENIQDANTAVKECRPLPTEISKTEREKWRKLINSFNSDSYAMQNFPGFPRQKEISWNLDECSENNMAGCDYEENSQESHFRGNLSQKNSPYRRSIAENINLAYENPLLEKTNQDDFGRSALQTAQNVYYVNVSKGTSFGIGEFGDVTCWNAGDFDTKDLEKPKDHGDGIPMQRPPEVCALKPEKMAGKVQYEENVQDSNSFICPEVQGDSDSKNYIPCRLKTSKSDNYINKKVSDCQTSNDSDMYCKYKSEAADIVRFSEKKTIHSVKSTTKSTTNSSSEEVGSDNIEFELERTPRLSRSLSNLRLLYGMYRREPSDSISISGSELFTMTPETSKPEKKSSSTLNSFLARRAREDKMAGRPGNWLKIKQTQGKKVKTKLRKKGENSSGQSVRESLPSRKGRPSVPSLKLRHPNCFQNFYKRFISVFCLTSHSSAATSK